MFTHVIVITLETHVIVITLDSNTENKNNIITG